MRIADSEGARGRRRSLRLSETILLLCLFPTLLIGVAGLADRAIKQQNIICQEGC